MCGMVKKLVSLILIVFGLLSMFSCAGESVSEQSPFNFSLGQYIGEKTYDEMLEMLDLEPKIDNHQELVLDGFDYEGASFDKILGFELNKDGDPKLNLVWYRGFFNDVSADNTDAVHGAVEKIYNELNSRFSPLEGDALYRENPHFDNSVSIPGMLERGELFAGVAYWEAEHDGCVISMSCDYHNQEHKYRISISEHISRIDN